MCVCCTHAHVLVSSGKATDEFVSPGLQSSHHLIADPKWPSGDMGRFTGLQDLPITHIINRNFGKDLGKVRQGKVQRPEPCPAFPTCHVTSVQSPAFLGSPHQYLQGHPSPSHL